MKLSLCIATSSSLPSEKAVSEPNFSSVQMLLRLSCIEETIFLLRSYQIGLLKSSRFFFSTHHALKYAHSQSLSIRFQFFLNTCKRIPKALILLKTLILLKNPTKELHVTCKWLQYLSQHIWISSSNRGNWKSLPVFTITHEAFRKEWAER